MSIVTNDSALPINNNDEKLLKETEIINHVKNESTLNEKSEKNDTEITKSEPEKTDTSKNESTLNEKSEKKRY